MHPARCRNYPSLTSAGPFDARRPSLRPCTAAGYQSKRPVSFTAFQSMSFSAGSAISIAMASTVYAPRAIRFIAIPTNALPSQATRRSEAKAGQGREPLMPVLFWICWDAEEERWLVTAEGNVYGEYLNYELAVLDAIDLADDARSGGNTAEVWHRESKARLY